MASTLYSNLKALQRLAPIRESMSAISGSPHFLESQAMRLNILITLYLDLISGLPAHELFPRYDPMELGVLVKISRSLGTPYGSYFPAFQCEKLVGLDTIMERKVQQWCFLLEAHQDPPTLEYVMSLRVDVDESFVKTVGLINKFIVTALNQEQEIAGELRKEMLAHREVDDGYCIQLGREYDVMNTAWDAPKDVTYAEKL